MTTFDDRENAFENKFAHDEEMKFKAEARCNKMLGLWAAELLGKSGDEAAEYAKTVIIAETVKGKGISYMEGSHEWHYLVGSEEQTQQAREELQTNCIAAEGEEANV